MTCILFLLVYLIYFLLFKSAVDGNQYASSLTLTTRYSEDEMQHFAELNMQNIDFKPSFYTKNTINFNRLINDSRGFDVDSKDVLVFLHIQKTAGTSFEKFLVYNLNISRPCLCNQTIKRCKCYRPRSSKEYWLFSRYSTGWQCGLHADWTELSNCVERSMDELERKLDLLG
jgi:hypothetical protein